MKFNRKEVIFMMEEKVEVKTPEYVSLKFEPAGLGSRAAANIIDQAIITVATLLILFITFLGVWGFDMYLGLGSVSPYLILGVVIVMFLLYWGYFAALEYFWNGKTIGKKILGIHVMQENGHRITLLSSVIRNLMRIVDQLPAYYVLGMIMVYAHPKHKRLGDLVAGTIVVHERRAKSKRMSRLDKEIQRRNLKSEDLKIEEWNMKQLGERDWTLLKGYAERFTNLPLGKRNELTKKMATVLFPKLELSKEQKTYEQLENTLLILYLKLRDEWEYEL